MVVMMNLKEKNKKRRLARRLKRDAKSLGFKAFKWNI